MTFYANLAWVIVLLIGSRMHNVSPVSTVRMGLVSDKVDLAKDANHSARRRN